MVATSGAATRTFNPRLESLRGVAALVVAFYHAGNARYLAADGETPAIAYNGDALGAVWNALLKAYVWLLAGHGAVVVFFVLSGYVLTLSLERMSGSGLRIAGIFMLRRVLRLWPPLLFMLAVFYVVRVTLGYSLFGMGDEVYSAWSMLMHALLIDNTINGVVWSLQIEAMAAPIILLTWLAWRRWGEVALWASLLLLLPVTFSNDLDRMMASLRLENLRPLQHLFAFVVGMMVPMLVRFTLRLNLPRPVAFLHPVVGLALLTSTPFLFKGNTFATYSLFMMVAGATMLIVAIVLDFNAWFDAFLDTRLMRFYGRISYSFYLLHPLTLMVLLTPMEWLADLVSLGVPKILLAIGIAVVSIAVVTPLSMLSYWLVEAPTMRLARRIGSRRPASTIELEPATT